MPGRNPTVWIVYQFFKGDTKKRTKLGEFECFEDANALRKTFINTSLDYNQGIRQGGFITGADVISIRVV